MKSPKGHKKLWRFLLFVYVSFVVLTSICLIKYCSGYLFGSSNHGVKVFPYLKSSAFLFKQKHLFLLSTLLLEYFSLSNNTFVVDGCHVLKSFKAYCTLVYHD